MHFAKLDSQGVPILTPINEKELRATLTHISFPATITPEMIEGTGYIYVRSGTIEEWPGSNVTHPARISSYVPDGQPGVYRPVYTRVEATPEQVQSATNKQLNEVRRLRRIKFIELDGWVSRAQRESRMGVPLTYSLEALDAYGQALADITESEDIFNITWPTI